ncbi:unnamed protein product [Umbelopsis vinacea]
MGANLEKSAEVPETVMQEIAVSILSYFSTVKPLTTSEQLIARIPTLSALVRPSDPTEISKDVLMTIMRLATSEQALKTILDQQVLSRILLLLGSDATAEEQELAKQLVILVYGTAFNEIGSQQEQSKALRASVLESLKYSFIPTLSSTLRLKQDTSKFVAVDVLHRVINECPTGILQELQIQERQRFDIWIESIRSGLRQILTSKTDSDRRDHAFSLTATLLRHIGPKWLFSTLAKTAKLPLMTPRQAEKRPESEKPIASNEAEIDARFPALLIQLASLEARLILDDLGDARRDANHKAIEPASSSDRSVSMLPMFYQIVESAIRYLTDDDLALEGTDIDLIFKIRQILTELFKAIIDFLNDVLSDSDTSDIFEDIVALASVRLLAIWTEEDDSINSEMSSNTLTMVETFREEQL